jgi:hypothetical protein
MHAGSLGNPCYYGPSFSLFVDSFSFRHWNFRLFIFLYKSGGAIPRVLVRVLQ